MCCELRLGSTAPTVRLRLRVSSMTVHTLFPCAILSFIPSTAPVFQRGVSRSSSRIRTAVYPWRFHRSGHVHVTNMSKPLPSDARITFVTGNDKKLREVCQILGNGDGPTLPLVAAPLDLPELQGTCQSIARAKCAEAARQVHGPVLVEDSALCFNALGGLPGPYIKWFLQEIGHVGLITMLQGFHDNSGYALCTFAYSSGTPKDNEDTVVLFEGRAEGTIVPPRSASGRDPFGWDAIFQPDGFDHTFAEMSPEVKNQISHRYRALCKVRAFLNPTAEAN